MTMSTLPRSEDVMVYIVLGASLIDMMSIRASADLAGHCQPLAALMELSRSLLIHW